MTTGLVADGSVSVDAVPEGRVSGGTFDGSVRTDAAFTFEVSVNLAAVPDVRLPHPAITTVIASAPTTLPHDIVPLAPLSRPIPCPAGLGYSARMAGHRAASPGNTASREWQSVRYCTISKRGKQGAQAKIVGGRDASAREFPSTGSSHPPWSGYRAPVPSICAPPISVRHRCRDDRYRLVGGHRRGKRRVDRRSNCRCRLRRPAGRWRSADRYRLVGGNRRGERQVDVQRVRMGGGRGRSSHLP